MKWNLVLYVLALAVAIVLGLALEDPLELILGFAAACWLGGWAAADLIRGR